MLKVQGHAEVTGICCTWDHVLSLGGCPKKSASSNRHDFHLSKNCTRQEEINIIVNNESLFLLPLLWGMTFKVLHYKVHFIHFHSDPTAELLISLVRVSPLSGSSSR